MTHTSKKQSGFTAVELLITLFVAAAFLIASYELFNLVIKDGGATRAQSRAANVAYAYLREYSDSSTTIPCTASSPYDNSLTVDGLTNVNVDVEVTCLPDAISSLSKVTVTVTYDAPQQTVSYSTFVSSSGGTNTADITNGLVAWWKLDGDATTEVGSPNGVIHNATSTTGETGVADTAYSFNGSTTNIITNSNFGLGTTNISISCWIYNPTASNHGIFVNVGSSTSGYGIGMGSTDTATAGTKLIMLLSGVRYGITSTNIGVGWHHVVMTLDGSGTPTAYLDGASAGSYAGTAPLAPVSNTTTIGGLTDASTHDFTGSIDDVRIYDRVLSLAEIIALYSAGAK
jgi:Tfp pilus assembly protein PilV